MESKQTYLTPEALAKLQGLKLRARHIVEGFVAGLHRSPYHGFSIEFAEHREYAPGDDLRHVDWKVFGRTDKIYLKQYEDETNLVCHLVVDVSESMQFQSSSAPLSKLEYAQATAASLGWLVLQQQDSVSLTTFDSEIRSLLRASNSPSHLQQILHVLEQSVGDEKTSTGPIFHALSERVVKRGVVVVLSDLFDDVDTMFAGLKHLRHRRHDVVLFHVLDPTELTFPFDQPTQFEGLEEMGDLRADPRSVRKAYLQEFEHYLEAVRKGCRDLQIDYQLLPTDQNFSVALANYLAHRQARVR